MAATYSRRLLMRRVSLPAVFILALFVSAAARCQDGVSALPPYLNPNLPVQTRVDDLVSRMTLEEKVSQMQNDAAAIPRLQVPAYNWWNEGLHGVARSGYATVFPQAVGLAATWDTDLIHRVATTISTEARAKYNQAIAEGNRSIYYGRRHQTRFQKAFLRSHLLVSQHQHRSRSPLGPRPGDLR